MPNLMDIAQRLTTQPAVALLLGERCLSERDLSACCTACADACPVEAIVLEDGAALAASSFGSVSKDRPTGPRIDGEACTQCGRCVIACPTAALVGVAPHDDRTLLDATARAAEAARRQTAAAQPASANAAEEAAANADANAAGPGDGEAADAGANAAAAAGFACTQAARMLRLDTQRTVTLPCLAWVDEALLVHAACAGARRISILTCNCADCGQAAAVKELPQTVARAQAIVDTWGIEATLDAVAAGDGGLAAREAPAAGEVSRRDLLSQAGSALTDAAAEAALSPIREYAGAEAAAGHEPEPDRRRWQLLDDLHAFGLPGGGAAVVPRCLAPRVDIDVERCSGCALCAQFCPTGALRKAGKAAGGKTVLEFDAALCRDCGTCTETCRYEALSCKEELTAAELFALEPREIVIPKRRVLPSRR